MQTIPTDSTDAREQREFEQARAENEAEAQIVHDNYCVLGWLGVDPEGRPIPCPTHRPHLLHVPCRTCSVPYATCALQQGRRRGQCCPDCEHSRRRPISTATPDRASTSPATGVGHAPGAAGSMAGHTAAISTEITSRLPASAPTYPSGRGPEARAGRVAPPTDTTAERTA